MRTELICYRGVRGIPATPTGIKRTTGQSEVGTVRKGIFLRLQVILFILFKYKNVYSIYNKADILSKFEKIPFH